MVSTSKADVHALLNRILRDADDLALDAEQFNSLTRLYLQHAPVPVLADVEALVSASQLRRAMLNLLEEKPETDKSAGPVSVADYAKGADTKYLEMELTGRVAERLASWMKLFAYFIALPVSALLLLLAVFGVSKFDDVQKIDDEANGALKRAQATLSNLSARESEIDTQLVSLREKSQTASQQISQLDCRTLKIEKKLGTASAWMWSGNAMNDSGMIVAWHTPGGEKMYGPWGIFPSGAAKVGATSSMASRFVGLKEGSAEFDVQWRAAAQEDPAGFAALQRAYVKRTSYDPSVAMILSDEKIDITKQSLAIQELVFTWTSMTGQGDTFFRWAADAMRSAGKWNPSSADFDRDLLSALYSAMEKTRYFQKNPKQFTRFKTAIGQSSVGGDCR